MERNLFMFNIEDIYTRKNKLKLELDSLEELYNSLSKAKET